MRRRDFIGIAATAAAWPAVARGGRSYRLAYLALLPGEDATLMKLLVERLHELGYVGEAELLVESRSAEGHPERLPELAGELVGAQPDVLIAGFGTLAAKAAKAATAGIPVVFTTVGDPVGAGVVANLARPGGNTGLTDQAADTAGKRLELLREVAPGKADFGVLMNPDTPYSALALTEIRKAAAIGQVGIHVLEAKTPDEVLHRLADAQTTGLAGLIVLGDPLTTGMQDRIADLAVQYRLPSIAQFRESAEAGALMSYGPDRRQIYRRAAEYVDKVLKGAKPADLPVEQPTKFELVINLKTAKVLDLTVPPILLAQADEVIE